MTHLRVIVEVAGRGSITAAAAALNYAQSAVSRQLQGAEAAAGTVLFERSVSGVQPTPAGVALLHHAQAVFAEMDAAAAELALLRGGLHGPLAVGAFPMAHAWLVPAALAAVTAQHPSIVPRLTEASSPALVKRVHSRLLHGALVAVGTGLPDYELDGLGVVAMPSGRGAGVMVAAQSTLAARDELSIDDLADRTWVEGVGERGDPQFGAWPGAQGATVGFSVRTWQARIGIVMAGLAISVAPAMIAPTLPPGVKWLPVSDDAFSGRRMLVITLPQPSPGARAFALAVSDVLRRTFRQA